MAGLFRATSTAAFDGLYRRYAASVYRYVYAVLGNHADAEDVTQQTFLNAYRSISQGTKPRKAENWLFTIAHNEVRRHFQSTRGKPLEVELDERLAHPAPERSEPSVTDILRALQRLPVTQRSALVMREFEGRSYAEIAQIMNVTQGALEALIFRARRSLAEQLEEGLTCAEAERVVSRRLDGRLARRDARSLKAHIRECPRCARFERLQRRQRSLLKGLSVMPVPASLFLFRGESAAAAAGLGAGATAAGGSAGVGAAGLATGLVAKAAAVTAAVTVAGGVGYGVAAGPDPVTKAERNATQAAPAAEKRMGTRLVEVEPAQPRSGQPRSARPASVRKSAKPKALPAKPPSAGKKPVKAKKVKAGPVRALGDPAPPVKARRVKARPAKRTAAKPVPPKTRSRPIVEKKQAKPAQAAVKATRSNDPGPPADAPGRGAEKKLSTG